MGVFGFVDQFDIKSFEDEYYNSTPLGLDFVFKHFPEENHNPVGLTSINYALKLMICPIK